MDRFLERSVLPVLTQEEIENPLSVREIEFIVKNFSTEKTLGPDDFTGKFYQIFKK